MNIKEKLELKFAEKFNLYLVDGKWNCDGGVDLSGMNLLKFPLTLVKLKVNFIVIITN